MPRVRRRAIPVTEGSLIRWGSGILAFDRQKAKGAGERPGIRHKLLDIS
jgi:hypothetical protein